MDPSAIKTLVDYHYWANGRMLSAVESLSAEQFTRDLGSSFPSIHATLAHMLHAESIWLGRFTGEPLPGVQPADVPTPAAVREFWRGLEQRLRALIAGLDADGLNRTILVRTSTGKEFVHPLWEALQHLVNHGTYHRGQVAGMLRQVGAPPNSTDLIQFYRERSGQV